MSDEEIEQIVEEYRGQYPRLITVAEATEIARLPSKETFYDWSHRGLLDGIKTKSGKRLLLNRDGFVRFLCARND